MKINYLNTIYSQVDKGVVKQLRQCLAYPGVFYVTHQYSKERKEYEKYYINKDGSFYTGLIPRLLEYARKKKLDLEVDYSYRETLKVENKPSVKELTFRGYQLKLIEDVINYQRGIIQSPTGSGKTEMMIGVISCFPSSKVLILAHTLDIVNQTATRIKKYGFKNVSVITGSRKEKLNQITLSTIQSFSKFDPSLYSTFFDIVFIDEAHHAAASQYGKVFSEILSPIRIGFTATPVIDKYKELVAEGYLGPVIGKLSIEEAGELGILATPKIKLLAVPEIQSIKDLSSYKAIYRAAIINSNVRNLLIVNEVERNKKENKTVLIIIKEIEHGINLESLCTKFGINVKFVRGSTDGEAREKIRQTLNNKECDCVISTAVWREGIDIPDLDCVIIGDVGKSHIMVKQVVGRGLRKTKDKEVVEVIDFLDPYKYLARHTIQRLQIYVNSGWL
uniref:Putative type III restriction enzyme n=1 Tax=viral metagenome TaxID=1070528 RepID=A0A6M3L859_9ZZZZ